MSIVRTVGFGGQYPTVQAAINDAVARDGPSNLNPLLVEVMPGIVGGDFTIPAYVTVQGAGLQASVVVGTATVQANGSLHRIKVLGEVVLEGSPDGACEMHTVIVASFSTTKPAVSVVLKPGVGGLYGAYIWNSIVGTHGPYAFLVSHPNVLAMEYFVRDTQFEMYGAAALVCARYNGASCNTRHKNVTYQVNHTVAPGCLGLAGDGAGVRDVHGFYETTGDLTQVKFVRAASAKVVLDKPAGFVEEWNKVEIFGGTVEVR